jgi:hypothetical protein
VRLPPISCAGMLPSGIYCICVKTSHRLVNIYRWHTLPSSAILTSDQWRIYMGAKGGPGPPTPKIFFKKNSNKNKIMLLILFICLVFPSQFYFSFNLALPYLQGWVRHCLRRFVSSFCFAVYGLRFL